MAKTGGGAAYQRLQVPQDGIGQAMQYWGGIEAKKRAAEKLEDAQAQKAKQKADEDAYKATRVPDDAFRTKVTGFDNRDDIARNFATKAMEGYTNSANLAREAWDRGDKAEYQRHLDNMDKTLGEFDNFTNNEEHLAGIAKQYADMATAGNLNPVDEEYEQFMEAFTQNNFEYYLDDNNIPHIRALLKDAEGNEYVKEVKASDFVNGNYRPYEKVHVEGKGGLIDEMLIGFGKRVYDQNTGNYINTTQKWDERNQASLDAKIKALTGDKRAMSSLLYQASGTTIKKMGDTDRNGPQDEYSSEDKQLVKDWITDQVLGAYDEKEKVDYTGALTRAEAAKKKGRTPKEDEYGKLRFDAQRALGQGGEDPEYTVFMGRHTDPETDMEYTVTDVIDNPNLNYFILVGDDTKNRKVPKTERAILEFKIKGQPEYKGLDVKEVMNPDPVKYRESRVGGSTPEKVLNTLYDAEGNITVDDEEVLKTLNESLGVTGEDYWEWTSPDWGEKMIKLKGYPTPININNKEEVRKALKSALSAQDNTQQGEVKLKGGTSR